MPPDSRGQIAPARGGRAITIEALLQLRRPGEAVCSPDGSRVAIPVQEPPSSGRSEAASGGIWIAEGDELTRATETGGLDLHPRWSPDGCEVAFTSDAGHPGRASLYLLSMNGHVKPVGRLAGSVEQIAWSGDGARLLVLAADPTLDTSSAQNATPIRGAESGDIDPLVYRPGSARRRLFFVDPVSGSTSEIDLGQGTVWEFDWDGAQRLAAVVSADSSESGWYTASLVVADIAGPTRELMRYTSDWQVAVPRLSPDSGTIAFLEGVCSDRGILAGVAMAAVVGENPVSIAPDAHFDCTWLQWRDARTLWCAGWRGIGSVCGVLEIGDGFTELWAGPSTLGSRLQARVSVDRAGRRPVAVMESANEPPEVVELAGGPTEPRRWVPVTHMNAELRDRAYPSWLRYQWRSADGAGIEGLLALPERGAESASLPLVVIIHGGPSSSWTSQWTNFGLPTLWTAVGYAVLMPNPRGSVGYGQHFARSTIGDMGGGELLDILSGVDALVGDGLVDDNRVGVLGASHGGYLTAWAITQTTRFAAAIAIAAPANRLSKLNGGNIGYLEKLFWDPDPYDPAGAVLGRSPIMHVRNVRTPTLILHGQIDQCVPVGQAYEFYRGIVSEATAEVELVIYPREGHSIREREHLIDVWERSRAWFDRHLGGQPMTP